MKFIEILFQFHSSSSKKTKLKLKSVSIVRYANRNCQQLCLFVRIEKKKMTTMVSIQWHIKLPHVFKENEETEKKDLLFGVHRFRSIFAFNKLDLYNSHSYLQRPKDSAALFFLLLRQNKSQYITCNFQSNKARYYWMLTTYQKKTILYASFVVQVPFIYEHTWVFLFNLYTIKSDILKSATEISTGKVFNKTFAWCVSALPNV